MFAYFMQSPSPASKKGWQPTRFWIRRAPQGKNPPYNTSPPANLSMKLFFHNIFCILLIRLQHSHSLLLARRAYGTSMESSFKLINSQLKYSAGWLTYLLVVLKPKVAESLHIGYVALTPRKWGHTHVGSSKKLYFWTIQYTHVDIFEESEQHNMYVLFILGKLLNIPSIDLWLVIKTLYLTAGGRPVTVQRTAKFSHKLERKCCIGENKRAL